MKYVLMLVLAVVAFPTFAATAKGAPLDVDADKLQVDQNSGHAVFTGNVKAIRGDWTMTGARADVAYYTDSQEKKQSGQDIKDITATGNVVITRHNLLVPNDVATGDKAVYTPANNTMVMTGSTVLLTRGGRTVQGTRLDYDTTTGQAVMTGGSAAVANGNGGRVHAHFQSDANGSK